MEQCANQQPEPIYPHELERLKTIYETARFSSRLSRHDPAAERLAAMAIRFYQLGIRDDELLLKTIVNAGRNLRQA
jgi:hypothetical protein